jgi:3-dehydroquinate synthase
MNPGANLPLDAKECARVNVDLASRSYPVVIAPRLAGIELPATLIRPAAKAIVVTNPTVAPLYLDPVRDALVPHYRGLHTVVIDDGEQYKTLASFERICAAMLEARADRRTVVYALGGGVIGDLAGFAAAAFMRGVDFVQLPTTLLAMVDSSVGGKTAVNHALGKNMIGAFHQPRLVWAGLDTLASLPRRELLAGVAEIIKYACIEDLELLRWLEQPQRLQDIVNEPTTLRAAIAASVRCKARIVAADELETGERAHLNFGHTLGHAIEATQGYGNWLHGEAVACGMAFAARLSARVGSLPAEAVERVEALIAAFDLPLRLPDAARVDDLLQAMRLDKKSEGGALRFVLLDALGRARVAKVDEALVARELERFLTLGRSAVDRARDRR